MTYDQAGKDMEGLSNEQEHEYSAEEITNKQNLLAKLDLFRRIQKARSSSLEERKDLVFDVVEEVLQALLDNQDTTEDELKILAYRRDVSAEFLRRLAGDHRTSASYKIKRFLLLNPKLPASAGLRLVGHVFLFDWVQILITPAIPMEIKTAAENLILQQYSAISLGQKITMARRANGIRLLPIMLNDPSSEVVRATLDNPFLNENLIANAVRKASFSHVVSLIADSPKWAVRQSVKIALLHNRYLSAGRATVLIQTLGPLELKELRSDPTVPMPIRNLMTQILSRTSNKPGRHF